MCNSLLSENLREPFLAEHVVREQADRDLHAGKGSSAVYLPCEEAKKQKFIVDWAKDNWSASLTGHYTDGFTDYTGDWDPSAPNDPATITQVASRITWDTQLNYTAFADSDRWYGDMKVTVGVRNVLDEDPPFVSGWGGNTNGYPGFLYNAEGRFTYLSLTKKL